jgi:DNA-directed RNA polymerase sigma subunit (sigma70/sigma32)
LGISKERVRQIESRALEKLRRTLLAAHAAEAQHAAL